MFLLKFLGLKSIIALTVVGVVVVVGAAALYLAVVGGVEIPGLSAAFRVVTTSSAELPEIVVLLIVDVVLVV